MFSPVKQSLISKIILVSSLRIPSTFCGLYTLRPSYERLPYAGAANALEGQESISSVLGPMTNSIAAVRIFTKAILSPQLLREAQGGNLKAASSAAARYTTASVLSIQKQEQVQMFDHDRLK